MLSETNVPKSFLSIFILVDKDFFYFLPVITCLLIIKQSSITKTKHSSGIFTFLKQFRYQLLHVYIYKENFVDKAQ